MPSYEFWVDPVTGSNSNAGTEAAPFQTLFHAAYNYLRLAGLWGPTTSVIVNVVPSGPIASGDFIAMHLNQLGGSVLVRSATAEPWTATNNYDTLIEMYPSTTTTLVVENCSCTRNRIIYPSGTEATGRDLNITITDSVFTHARTNVEAGIWIRPTPAGSGTLTLADCEFSGWDIPVNIALGSLDSIEIRDTSFSSNGTTAPTGGTSTIAADDVLISGATITMANSSVANRIDINATNSITINNETAIDIKTTGSIATWIRTLTSGSSTIDVDIRDSSFYATCGSGGWSLFVGRDLNTAITRAANKALGSNLQSCLVKNCDIVQRGLDAGALALMVDTDNAITDDCYLRVGGLGDATNVHNVYLWGDGITFQGNLLQGQLLAFGPDQFIENNLIVADRCILLGGTMAGSTTSGGGNNYTIRGNALITFADDGYSDYSFNSAYPTNLGELEALIDWNQYTVLSGGNGIARLTESDLLATTMAELRNIWQNSALSGSGSVYGAASNATNDQRSTLVPTTSVTGAYAASICVQSAELTRAQLQGLWNRYTADRSAATMRILLLL